LEIQLLSALVLAVAGMAIEEQGGELRSDFVEQSGRLDISLPPGGAPRPSAHPGDAPT
jgi:hypothetical protein